MDFFQNHHYRGEIQYNGERFIFEPASEMDTAQLAGMYAGIAIHAGNYREKFDRSSPDSFAKTGGMFVVHNEDSIRLELARGDSFFAVLREPGGKIASSFWVSREEPHMRELIVVRKQKGIAHAMFYTVLRTLEQIGYTHSRCEVYEVLSYKDESGEVELNMLNERSYNMVLAVGGEYIDTAPAFEINLDSLTVAIVPRVFYFDYAALLPGLAQKLETLGMKIIFHEAVKA
jgi:hypothetical protein